jgi:hypothetical protein
MKRTKKKNQKEQEKKARKEQSPVSNGTETKPIIWAATALLLTIAINYLLAVPYSADMQNMIKLPQDLQILTFVLAIIVFLLYFRAKTKLSGNISKYLFLTLFLFSVFVSFLTELDFTNKHPNLFLKLYGYQVTIIIPTTALGILSLIQHKEKLNAIINRYFSSSETKRTNIYTFRKIFTRKNLPYTAAFLTLMVVSAFTLFYRLDYFPLYSDEAQVTQGAAGYYYTGEYKQWDFAEKEIEEQNYNRAKPHQFVVAQSYKLFGISTWSSRLPSVVFGLLFLITGFFTAHFFTKNKFVSLAILILFVFFFEYLQLERWTRMYSMLMFLFLLTALFAYKFVSGKNKLKPSFLKGSESLAPYFDFDYSYLLPFLLMLYISYKIHPNAFVIMPVMLVFVIFSAALFRDKKYFLLSVLGIVLLVVQGIFPFAVNYGWFTFFEVENSSAYTEFLFGFPFNPPANLVVVLTAVSALFISKNKEFRKKSLFLTATALTAWVLFSYIIQYKFSFRYIAHISPFLIILITSAAFLTAKTLFKTTGSIMLALLITAFAGVHFSEAYSRLYEKNKAAPAKTRTAYGTVIDNYQQGEIIYQHWGPTFYYKDLETAAHKIKLHGSAFNEFIDTLQTYKKGWVVWSKHNEHVLEPDIVKFSNLYLKKYHGFGTDTTNVEVFRFFDNQTIDTTNFREDIQLPYANLNLEHAYSLAFWINLPETAIQVPFFIRENKQNILKVQPEKGSIRIAYNDKDVIYTENIADTNWHHIVWYQESGEKGANFGVLVDGEPTAEIQLSKSAGALVKFKVNKLFDGFLDDIRIYNFVLNKNQTAVIMSSRGIPNTQELMSEGESFSALFHWQKKQQ